MWGLATRGPGAGGSLWTSSFNSPCYPTGILRVWEAASGQCVYTQPQMPGLRQELTHCTLARAADLLLTVTADHNLLLYEAHSLQLQKQVSICSCPVQGLGCRLLCMQALTHDLPVSHSLLAIVRKYWMFASWGPVTPTSSWLPTALA